MTKEAKELIAKQKKLFIKINTTALNDIENELNESNKKKGNKKKSNKKKGNKRMTPVAESSNAVKKKKKAKNYILDLTDHSKGSQSIMFSDDLKLYLRNTCSTPPLKPFVPRIETIEMFEKKNNSSTFTHMKKLLKALNSFGSTIKFWSYVFEEAFSNRGLCLHWGDTMPKKAKKYEKIDMKIDLRILFCSNTKRPDLSVGEFAKSAIPYKLYHDKLKQITVSKYHLNTLLLSGLPLSAALIPIVQITGFECHLYVLKKVEDFYILETVDSITFPTTYKAIKDNGIKKLISCLEKAKSLCLSLKREIKENGLYKTTGKMGGILENKKREGRAAVHAVVWPTKEHDAEEDDEEEDDEEEDDEEEDDEEEVDDEDASEEDLARVRS
ncbi:hypothetical protein G6F57_002730 [Rhizopus arrhizus]|uniref:Uncharacterized protein n=1 Tax=Rhizopus oryzae TaxID=64495 RepID=A0A9P7BTB8_RHIOR|nr:hypothetical protein G6F33_004400 [Rhizopus arrhizus]KAG1404219.1 hypothetical protein G6F58_010223 [Rhizopus delemar]KAG0933749.1 hypothetical protein G6F30_010135 [Rhizopus arrhizus]KAG0983460.1 hypothetical protein G6F29_005521 [Rhizopus arrhizus]KAG0997679.1 hypothetical protein G6F28_002676 [Rhizopus arrhizus]